MSLLTPPFELSQYTTSLTKPVATANSHKMPVVDIPHLALKDVSVEVGEDDWAVINKVFSESHFPFYQDNKGFALDLMRFNLTNNLGGELVVEKLLNAEPYSKEQVDIFQTLASDTLIALEERLKVFQNELHPLLSSCDIEVVDSLVDYCKSHFSPSLSISDGTANSYSYENDYGSNDHIVLRMEHEMLSVICIDLLDDAPYSLQVIGGLLLRRLTHVSEKYIGKDLWGTHGVMIDPDEFEGLEKLPFSEKQKLSDLLCENDIESATEILASHNISFEHLDPHSIEWHLAQLLDVQLSCPYLDDVSVKDAWVEHDKFIKVIGEHIKAIKKCTSPLKCHPTFLHLDKLTNFYMEQFTLVSHCLFHASDIDIRSYNVVSLDINSEDEMLTEHNNYLSELQEIGAIGLDITNPDLLPHFRNHILCEMLLCAFDNVVTTKP